MRQATVPPRTAVTRPSVRVSRENISDLGRGDYGRLRSRPTRTDGFPGNRRLVTSSDVDAVNFDFCAGGRHQSIGSAGKPPHFAQPGATAWNNRYPVTPVVS